MGEEQLGKDETCDRAVEKEIVPFDCRADRRGNDGTAKLRLMLGRGKNVRMYRGHECTLQYRRTLLNACILSKVPAPCRVCGTATAGFRSHPVIPEECDEEACSLFDNCRVCFC